jgi:Outer membrane protein beta-barrel domain
MRRLVFLALASAVTLASTARAQSLSFAPQIGIYIPTENLYKLASGGSSDFQLEAGPSFGARLGLWFGSRFGIEAGGSYIPTTFKLTSTGGSSPVKEDAKLFLGSGQAVLYLLPRTGIFSVFINGGVGVVSRGGVAFTHEAKTSDVGAMFGGGAGVHLGPIMLTAGVDLLSYNASYQGTQVTTQELKQRDLNVKVGFGFPFGGGAPRR